MSSPPPPTMLTQPSEPTWKTVIRLLRWHKPAGRLILMIPALWAVVLAAQGTPPLPLIGIIILGTLATSAAGCVANDLWDRNIDNQVERTQSRPLASRALSIKTGIVVGLVSLLCAAGLASYLNRFSFALCVAAVPVILLYPAAKRVFPVPQLVLSLAWGFAVLISWSAVEGGLTASTWWLWGATVWWTLGFDTIYALSDREDDLKIGINSSAIFFGEAVVGAIALCFIATVVCLGVVGIQLGLGSEFWLALVVATGGWTWQVARLQEETLPRPAFGDLFAQNVWLGFGVLLGMLLGL
ncbi:MAG: 4-hydroxybenzoate octaprenyltransferase UbiA [Phormidium sp. OSCR]|nr:MAG: 4-hydroxybenzoate octaprenyltransferase UbiA [Phormidium sp. OSCR]